MSLFDFYIMVDWSGAPRHRGRRSDTIWVAHGSTTEDAPLTDSPFSRTEAIRLIRSLLLKEIAARKRVLVGFDFAYGYPVDFAAALQAATGRSDQELPWLTVWRYFSETTKDDEATTPGGKPSNRSNRFEIANQITSFFIRSRERRAVLVRITRSSLPVHPAKASASTISNCAGLPH
jgi:precorrin-8X/cobalt-precorrin-8 methylmutase